MIPTLAAGQEDLKSNQPKQPRPVQHLPSPLCFLYSTHPAFSLLPTTSLVPTSVSSAQTTHFRYSLKKTHASNQSGGINYKDQEGCTRKEMKHWAISMLWLRELEKGALEVSQWSQRVELALGWTTCISETGKARCGTQQRADLVCTTMGTKKLPKNERS